MYCTVLKPQLRARAAYLDDGLSRADRVCLARLRVGANDLYANAHHWRDGVRGCPWCLAPSEDQRHFLLHCPAFGTLRAALTEQMRAVLAPGAWDGMGDEARVWLLLCGDQPVSSSPPGQRARVRASAAGVRAAARAAGVGAHSAHSAHEQGRAQSPAASPARRAGVRTGSPGVCAGAGADAHAGAAGARSAHSALDETIVQEEVRRLTVQGVAVRFVRRAWRQRAQLAGLAQAG